jgi:anti-sigma B factor antagonist
VELKRTTPRPDVTVLAAEGEMDLYNAGEFKSAVDSIFSSGVSVAIVDFDQLTYVDSSGIGAMLYAFSQVALAESTSASQISPAASGRVVELTSLTGSFPSLNRSQMR